MMTPRSPLSTSGSFLIIANAAKRTMLNVPVKLMPMTLFQVSSGNGLPFETVFAASTTPAQLTAMCSAPNFSSAASMLLFTSCSSATSTTRVITLLPTSFASCLSLSALTSTPIIFAPAAASALHDAYPSPEAAPVTIATLSFTCMTLFPLCCLSSDRAGTRARCARQLSSQGRMAAHRIAQRGSRADSLISVQPAPRHFL